MAVDRVMQEQLPSLHEVNEDFEHRPTANGSGAIDFEQVLKKGVMQQDISDAFL